MTVLYLVCLPASLIGLAVAFATERNQYQTLPSGT